MAAPRTRARQTKPGAAANGVARGGGAPAARGAAALLCGGVALVVALSLATLFDTPPPLPASAPATAFSEARAAAHVARLAGAIGERQVGSRGAAAAAAYVFDQASSIAAAARAAGLDARAYEDTVSGAFEGKFLQFGFSSVYEKVPNIVLSITPPAANATAAAVLLAAHYDSTLGSPGAADAAACVAAVLESARALVARHASGAPLAAPLVALLNGGEEALMVASAGFMAGLAKSGLPPIGAFLNVESTGADGPAVLFQATGATAARAYARGAARPRGTVVAQDVFDAGLMPADTDYKLFAFPPGGHKEKVGQNGAPAPPAGLPGLDVALVLGAEVYHTRADAPWRLKPGTLQALGADVVGVASEAARALAAAAAAAPRGAPPPTLAGGGRAVYFDVLGRAMVVYSASTGRWLHPAPGVVAAVVWLCLPRARRASAVASAAASAASMALAAALPGVLGATLAASTARAIPWFGARGAAAACAFVPAALAGWLLPFTAPAPARAALTDPAAAALGSALSAGAAAAALAAGGFGTAYLPAAWAATALALALLPSTLPPRPRAIATLLLTAPAVAAFSPNAAALTVHLFQKASFAGAPLPPPYGILLGDAVAGAATGAGVVCALGVLGPAAVAAAGGARRARCAAATLLTLAAAAWLLSAAAARHPYTPAAPKKLFVQLVHRGDSERVWAAAGVDARSVVDALPSPAAWTRGPRARAPADWLALYPMGAVLDTATAVAGAGGPLPLPQSGGGVSSPLRVTARRSPSSPATDRVHVSIHLPPDRGGFAAANVSGRVAAWGRAGVEATTKVEGGAPASAAWRVVRMVGSPARDAHALWFDVAAGSRLRVAVAAAGVAEGAAAVAAALPKWTSAAVLETYTGEWEF